MNASNTWENFSTFLDQQQQLDQPVPGQMPDWSQNFQLGQRPAYNENINTQSSTYPGVSALPQYPGVPWNFNPNMAISGNYQYGAQQSGGTGTPTQDMNTTGGLSTNFGQNQKYAEQRERNRGGAYGSAKRDKLGNWAFN